MHDHLGGQDIKPKGGPATLLQVKKRYRGSGIEQFSPYFIQSRSSGPNGISDSFHSVVPVGERVWDVWAAKCGSRKEK